MLHLSKNWLDNSTCVKSVNTYSINGLLSPSLIKISYSLEWNFEMVTSRTGWRKRWMFERVRINKYASFECGRLRHSLCWSPAWNFFSFYICTSFNFCPCQVFRREKKGFPTFARGWIGSQWLCVTHLNIRTLSLLLHQKSKNGDSNQRCFNRIKRLLT